MSQTYRLYDFHIYSGEMLEIISVEHTDLLKAVAYVCSRTDLNKSTIREIYDRSELQKPVCIYSNDEGFTNNSIADAIELSSRSIPTTYGLFLHDGTCVMQGSPRFLLKQSQYHLDAVVAQIIGEKNNNLVNGGQFIGREYDPEMGI